MTKSSLNWTILTKYWKVLIGIDYPTRMIVEDWIQLILGHKLKRFPKLTWQYRKYRRTCNLFLISQSLENVMSGETPKFVLYDPEDVWLRIFVLSMFLAGEISLDWSQWFCWECRSWGCVWKMINLLRDWEGEWSGWRWVQRGFEDGLWRLLSWEAECYKWFGRYG